MSLSSAASGKGLDADRSCSFPVRLSMYIVCAVSLSASLIVFPVLMLTLASLHSPFPQPIAGAFGGLLASGILKLDSIGSLHSWKMIFFVEGIITTGLGILSYFAITDRIETAPWLSQEEKDLATSRMRADHAGSSDDTIVEGMKKQQVIAGIFNVTSLTLSFSFLLDNISVQGVAFFLPTIVQLLFPGQSLVNQQLLTVPPYIVGAAVVILLPYLSMKFRRRGIFVVISGLLMIIGYSMYVGTSVSSSSVRYVASFFVASGAFPLGALLPGWAR